MVCHLEEDAIVMNRGNVFEFSMFRVTVRPTRF